MKKTIVFLAGDGIGPEVARAAVTVLREAAHEFHHQFEFAEFPIGGAAIDAAGIPLPNPTLDACRKADAVFLGAVGGPKWDSLPVGKRPESGLLALRQGMGLYVNVRPVKLLEPLRGISPLKADRLGDLDLEIVRELAGGMYFGERGNVVENGVERAFDTESYSTSEIERIATFAFARAESRSRRVCSVDKANVLASSQLWRRTVAAMSAAYPGIRLEHMYVDNAAMQLTLRPSQFDVILTTNMFGDILSDAAAALAGSIGVIPSASFGSSAPLFEPIHGVAGGHGHGKSYWLDSQRRYDAARRLRAVAGSGLGGAIAAARPQRRLPHSRHRRTWRPHRIWLGVHGNAPRRDAAHARARRALRLGRLAIRRAFFPVTSR